MTIEASDSVREATLLIPRNMLDLLRAGTDSSNETAGLMGTAGLSPMHTIIAGVSLSLSFFFGGIWFVRSQRWGRSGVALVLAACALAAAVTTIASANAGPPRSSPLNAGTLPRAVASGESLAGDVRVVIVPAGGRIRLIVPKAESGK